MTYPEKISSSNLHYNDPLLPDHPELYIPDDELEPLLQSLLEKEVLGNIPPRTRSKLSKQILCRVLGYPVPSAFTKTTPIFVGQNFDPYVQKANNLQIWNQPIVPSRRYVLIKPDEEGVIRKVRVVTGVELEKLDKTGKLTKKYQARITPLPTCEAMTQFSTTDSEFITQHYDSSYSGPDGTTKPISPPRSGHLYSLDELAKRLTPLIGCSFKDPGGDQDRNRGAEIHKKVSDLLGYSDHSDNGQYPDIQNQLLEIKLQTSPTIDLGCYLPSSVDAVQGVKIDGNPVVCEDVRYAVFYAVIEGDVFTVKHIYLGHGADFFTPFTQFAGSGDSKIQIPLPRDFFC